MRLTQQRLKELLSYNPDTGVFTRLVTVKGNAKAGDVAGSFDGEGYLSIMIDSKDYQSHRLAWMYVHGAFPADQIDHINHDRADNRIVNLRETDHRTNSKNRSISKNNTSGVMGVTWNKSSNCWQAQINSNGKCIYLGAFKAIEDAAAARRNGEIKHGFHENHGRPRVANHKHKGMLGR